MYSGIMFTVVDVAQAFDISKPTVRYWAAEFAQYLDPDANPPKGRTRQFTDNDMTVFALISEMRERESAPYDDIHAALAAGERGQVPIIDQVDQEPPAVALVPLTAVEQFTKQITQQYEGEIDNLRGQLESERRARLEAVERAVSAETELRILRDREGEEPTQERRPGWLGRLLGKG